MASSPVLEWVEILQKINTLETQLVLTGGIFLLALILAKLLAPMVTRIARGAFDRAMERQGLRDGVETVRTVTPWWLSIRTFTLLLQLMVLAITAVALVAVWGQIDLAVTILEAAAISVPTVVQLLSTFFLFLVAYVAINLFRAWLSSLTERSTQFTEHQEEVAFRVLQIVVFVGVGLIVLSLWGVDLGGLLIGAGFLGIVAGMAAQQTLGSLIAGFVLMFSRPFEIGDWVAIGDREGIVTEISIVNTRLENFDGEYVIVPNDVVSNSTIVNRTRKGRLRIRVEVGIDYGDDPERARTVAKEALKGVDDLLSVPRPQVVTTRLGDSSVVLELRFWIDKPSARRRARATSAAIRAVKAAFEREDITIPFPQRELSGRDQPEGFRVVDSAQTTED